MDFGIISIILGIVLIAGIIFYKKPNPNSTDENPINSVYRRGIEILSPLLKWGIPLFLIASGIYYYRTINKESLIKREAEEREIRRQIHFVQLIDILKTPRSEREMKILSLEFDPKGANDSGPYYERDYNEKIESWETGIVRFHTPSKEAYLRIFNEAKLDSFSYNNDFSNNVGDKFTEYRKGSLTVSLGYFSNTQRYCCILSDDSKTEKAPEFLPISFLIGSWGRISTLHEGKFTFKGDLTFKFEDSREGSIFGNWKTEGKTIVLNYDKQKGEYGISHGLSLKTEIIHIKNKMYNTIEGYLDNEFDNITLSRQ